MNCIFNSSQIMQKFCLRNMTEFNFPYTKPSNHICGCIFKHIKLIMWHARLSGICLQQGFCRFYEGNFKTF